MPSAADVSRDSIPTPSTRTGVARTFRSATAQTKPGVLTQGEGTGLADHQPGPHAPYGPGLGPTSKGTSPRGCKRSFLDSRVGGTRAESHLGRHFTQTV